MTVPADHARRRPASKFVKCLDQAVHQSADARRAATPELGASKNGRAAFSNCHRGALVVGSNSRVSLTGKCVHGPASLCPLVREHRIRPDWPSSCGQTTISYDFLNGRGLLQPEDKTSL